MLASGEVQLLWLPRAHDALFSRICYLLNPKVHDESFSLKIIFKIKLSSERKDLAYTILLIVQSFCDVINKKFTDLNCKIKIFYSPWDLWRSRSPRVCVLSRRRLASERWAVPRRFQLTADPNSSPGRICGQTRQSSPNWSPGRRSPQQNCDPFRRRLLSLDHYWNKSTKKL